jgi:hypothetical protein
LKSTDPSINYSGTATLPEVTLVAEFTITKRGQNTVELFVNLHKQTKIFIHQDKKNTRQEAVRRKFIKIFSWGWSSARSPLGIIKVKKNSDDRFTTK